MSLTSNSVYLYRNGSKIGVLKSVQFTVDIETLPTTKQGSTDKKVKKSLRSTSIKASLYYDPADEEATAFIESVYSDSTDIDNLTIVFSETLDLFITADVVMTNLSMSMSFGAAQIADISLQVTGKPTTIKISPIDPPEYTYI